MTVPESVLITADAAVEALTAAAWTEPVREDAYETAVATVRTICEAVPDGPERVLAAGILGAIDGAIGTPRKRIHCFLGGFGADWDLDEAARFVREADKVGWAPSIFRHELAALKDGKLCTFDVRAPEATP
jgi:hypothetical protein